MVENVRGKTGHHFTNWATTYSCSPELFFEPRDREELKQILETARSKSRKVRVVGYGHSPSDLTCTPEYMISLNHMDSVLNIDKEKQTIKVEAGAPLEKINEALHANGLALSVLGSISEPTIAGAISTGTHGTGINYGTLASYILDMELLTAQGEVVALSRDSDESVFLAACTSLGSLGVILTLTIQCEPAYRLRQNHYSAKLDDILQNLDVHLKSSEHFRFMWFPHTEYCSVFHINRTDQPISNPGSWFWDKFIGYYVLEFILWLSTFCTFIVPYINKLYRYLNRKHTECVDQSYNVFNFDCLFKQYVMEWAFPKEKTAQVLLELRAWIDNNKYPAHFPAEVRFVKGDDMFLSPAYGTDSCYVNIIMYRPYNKYVPFEKYWAAFQKIVMDAGGRPHWAKDHEVTEKQFAEMYPKWEEFCTIRKRLDPNGMFINENLKRVFADKL